MEKTTQKIFVLGIIVIILAVAFGYFIIAREKNKAPASQLVSVNTASLVPSDYSYKKVIYNSWGTFKSLGGKILSIESTALADSNGKLLEENLKNPVMTEKKFLLAPGAVIVEPSDNGQAIADISKLKAGDRLGFKTKAVPDQSTGYEIITDLLILPPVPDNIVNPPAPEDIINKKTPKN